MDAPLITFCHEDKRDRAPGRPKRNVADRAAMLAVGLRLKELRQVYRMSQKGIAESVGLSQTAWSHYETGLRMPDQFEAVRLAGRLGITLDYLLTGDTAGLPRPLAISLARQNPEPASSSRTASDKGRRRA